MSLLLAQQHQKIGIFGLGKTGISAYEALSKVAEIICYDQNNDIQEAFVRQYGGSHLVEISDARWRRLDKIVLSPGISLNHDIVKLAQAHGIPLTSDIELLFAECKSADFIAITGTNGKSTTVSLTGYILQYNGLKYPVGGNIGIPVLGMNLKADGYVLELSSFQLDLLTDFKAKIAVLLNITKDHLDRHGSLENYIAAKKKIFDRQDKDSFAVISVDHTITNQIFEQLTRENKTNLIPANLIPISTSKVLASGVSICYNTIYDKIAVPCTLDLPNNKYLQGTHNQENIAASYAVSRILGLPPEGIVAAIQEFKGLPHRMQYLGSLTGEQLSGNTINSIYSSADDFAASRDGAKPIDNRRATSNDARKFISEEYSEINFYNDSKATNAEAAYKSISLLDNIYWLAGGIAKEGGIAELAPLFPKIHKAYLFGQDKEILARSLQGKVNFQICDDLTQSFNAAVLDAQADIRSIKNILLAPACASFDQFKNFEERGELFIKLYNRLHDTPHFLYTPWI